MRSLAVSLGALLGACGDSTAPPALHFATLGELHDAIAAARSSPDPAVRSDVDIDGIPDGIERALGTAPDDRDSDRDGLVDNVELFGTGTFDRAAPLPDLDGDGLIAPIDVDDNSDGVNDGAQIDSDGDGIANYLEYYGYRYDWLTGTFVEWDGTATPPYYRTDPLQSSTDQDAYSDSAEVSRIGLDVTVQPPGDHPLVPAIPNIVVELVGYSVTLNQTITFEEGQSLAVGQTWERSTEQSNSFTDERNWEVGIEAGYASSSAQVLVHANYGESYSNTQSTSTVIAAGGSVLDDRQWSVARTTNPTDAARMKLYVKVHNRGGAPLSTIIPTLTLKIGGLDIKTFQPGDAQVNILVPGGTYPHDPAVRWVIDTSDGAAPLALTMRELRALESGAPVSLVATQLRGDVMRLNADSAWERIGDVNEYLARCDAVSANIQIDLGDGTYVHHLVYAGDGESSVPVTLRDALVLLGIGDDGVLRFVDAAGAPRSISLGGYAFVFDPETLRRNGWQFGNEGPAQPPADFALEAMRLFPNTTLFVRAPREQANAPGPVIHFAYLDTEQREVKVCASDYQGITSVVVRNGDVDHALPLTEDIAGAGYFTALTTALVPGEEYYVVATNRSGQTAQRALGSLFVQPGPRQPLIRTVTLDLASHRIYANVESGAPDDPNSELEWIRAYHPGLPGGFVTLESVPNAFEDPNGYTTTLPPAFMSSNIEVVAYVDTGVFARHRVTEAEIVTALVAGTIHLPGHIDTTGIDEEWYVPWLDLDTGAYARDFHEADYWSATWNPTPPVDLWVYVDEGPTGYLYVNGAYVLVPSGYTFDTLTREEVESFVPSQTAPLQLNHSTGLEQGDILAIRTTEGHYAKVRVAAFIFSDNGWTNAYGRTLVIDYVTWSNPVVDD